MDVASAGGQAKVVRAREGAPRYLFVLGAPRSGTSWIQKSLAEQAGWVTVPELHYAVEVLRPVLNAWSRKAAKLDRALGALESGGSQPERLIGMPASLEFDDLICALRQPLDSLVDRASVSYGPVEVFLEKTPSNSVLVPYLSQVFPDGYMLHVIRDPRSMVRSLRSASSGWGAEWAPRSILVCALMWRTFVAAARRGRTTAPHYLEVKYEDAHQNLAAEVARVRSWLGVPGRAEAISNGNGSGRHEIVSSRVAQTLGSASVGEPEGFGDGASPRPELSRRQRWLVEVVTAGLMEECGYTVRSRTAKRLNRVLERLAAPLVARLSERRKEDVMLNLRLLRPTPWFRARLSRRT